ncbi:hypothetical protein FGK63_03140 [Ruegeria sediminis]|uniref:Uncharacterized protein n=1 Tax=Ruegeria sediminis TaxID=2583820 RepID=A0ABY2X3V5_9RHOB|nr:hypothetical protein [Ruegeria sediminis]TMV10071.1 hypothetical protein FGK63_03140 [Ruegeria sediminis]
MLRKIVHAVAACAAGTAFAAAAMAIGFVASPAAVRTPLPSATQILLPLDQAEIPLIARPQTGRLSIPAGRPTRRVALSARVTGDLVRDLAQIHPGLPGL